MPLILQHRIFRKDLKNNPKVLYLFGDNEARYGLGGQAKEMRNEPNAIGVATKHRPSMDEDAFWRHEGFDRCCKVITTDLAPAVKHLIAGGIVICPSDGLGTGYSELDKRAPNILSYINDSIKFMRTIE